MITRVKSLTTHTLNIYKELPQISMQYRTNLLEKIDRKKMNN